MKEGILSSCASRKWVGGKRSCGRPFSAFFPDCNQSVLLCGISTFASGAGACARFDAVSLIDLG